MTAFRDRLGRVLFVHDGLSSDKRWGTFYRRDNGSLRRVCSPYLPMRADRADAEGDLELYATAHRLPEVVQP